jgi:predicted amidohydrolase
VRDLTAAVWQTEPQPGRVEDNLRSLAHAAEDAAGRHADLLVAPEMCLTGWHPDATSLAVAPDGRLVGRLADLAADHGIWLALSLLTTEDGAYHNTFTLLSPKGRVAGRQRKIHLWAAEQQTVTPGTTPRPIDTDWGRAGGVVCYDVEFPEVCRALALDGAEVFLVPSAFYSPTGWDLSTRTRALENGCYLVAANQVGGPGPTPHNGMSRIVDPYGNVTAHVEGATGLAVAELQADQIQAARDYAPFLHDLRLGRDRVVDA